MLPAAALLPLLVLWVQAARAWRRRSAAAGGSAAVAGGAAATGGAATRVAPELGGAVAGAATARGRAVAGATDPAPGAPAPGTVDPVPRAAGLAGAGGGGAAGSLPMAPVGPAPVAGGAGDPCPDRAGDPARGLVGHRVHVVLRGGRRLAGQRLVAVAGPFLVLCQGGVVTFVRRDRVVALALGGREGGPGAPGPATPAQPAALLPAAPIPLPAAGGTEGATPGDLAATPPRAGGGAEPVGAPAPDADGAAWQLLSVFRPRRGRWPTYLPAP